MAACPSKSELLDSYKNLKSDGIDRIRCWIYCGVFRENIGTTLTSENPQDLSRSRLGILLAERMSHHVQPLLGAA